VRLFAIVQWHHFAYMVISIALLGFGASGTFLALTRGWLTTRFVSAFATSSTLFAVTSLLCFAVAQRLPFNALAVIWDPRQILYLVALYLLFTLPFFCGANCVGLAFIRFPDRIGRVYRYNLVGSGVGAFGIVLALFLLFPAAGLRLVAGLGIAAAALACLDQGTGRRPRVGVGLALLALVLPLAIPRSWTSLRVSEYKGLSRALQVPGAEVLNEHSSPLGLITVVRIPTIPFRHVPGLSLNHTVEPPAQLGVFTDGDGLSVITAFDGRREPLTYLDFTTGALPYHLLQRPDVLILGAGGGADVLQALYHDAARIDAVELNAQVVWLVEEAHAGFAGDLYRRPGVRVHVAEARGFVTGSDEKWDLIQIPLLDSFGAAAAGVHSLSESYLYTVEAFREFVRHLRPGGLLAITRWLKVPPRDSLKLFATALAALEREGSSEPARQLALIRGWNATTLIAKNGALGPEEIAAIRVFAEERSFDVAYYPGMPAEEANRSNLLAAPYLYEGATALAGAGEARYRARYKFDITPASDDRPYFFDFFRWRALPELLELRKRGGAALLEWGYLILFATLVQAGLLSIGLILLPLWVRRGRAASGRYTWRIAAYFLALGLAFLFVEIAYIQRFIVFLSHPLYAVAVVLCAFLVFAGMGSGYAPRLAERLAGGDARRGPRISAIELAVLGIGVISVTYLVVLPPVFRWLMPLSITLKILVSLVLIAPLAFGMGMPFPLGLSRVSERVPELVPWAWGINGCASVLSAILATILAMHFGFTLVVASALVLYVAAAAVFRGPLLGRG
jgi:SAM-dependent methyltransferase